MDEKLLAEVNVLITRAEEEREEISQLINRLYRDSPPTDTLALNPVYSFRQDKIVAWQQDFDKLPKPRPVQEKVINEKAYKKTSAFGTVRAAMWPKKPGLPLGFDNPHVPSSSVSEAEEVSPTSRRGKNKVNNFTSSASETSEIEPDTTSAESTAKIDPKEGEPMILEHPVITESPIESKHQATDPESDSTIGAAQEDAAQENTALPEKPDLNTLKASRTGENSLSSACDCVRKRARISFSPTNPQYEVEKPSSPNQEAIYLGLRARLYGQCSTVVFDPFQALPRRNPSQQPHSRPIVSAFESVRSRDSSRRASPEKRSVSGKTKEVRFNQPGSPPHGRAPSGKLGKSRLTTRTNPADKPQLRRDTERSKTRYAVIRGKKARPVASARAKVEILESIKDVVQDDESEGLNSSSEADDEGEGDEDRNEHGKPSLPPVVQSTPDSEPQIEESAKTAPADTFPVPHPIPPLRIQQNSSPSALDHHIIAPSPFLTATKNRSVSTPPQQTSTLEGRPETLSESYFVFFASTAGIPMGAGERACE
ncbi:1-phosphatidylinositol-3-phosphate kinase [Salix suchowensis]|nr:1-phosphatidylinositol-3-phosphate kinase [Salix suchowensis]